MPECELRRRLQYLGGMHLSSLWVNRIAVVVLLAFIGVRLGDAHLHVCLDGQEAPVTIHTSDGSIHHDTYHDDEQHQDLDIQSLDTALLKAGLDTDAFVLAIAFALVDLIQQPVLTIREALTLPSLKPLAHLRPPLRGPPR